MGWVEENILDPIGDAVDWVVDEIVDPVVNTVVGVVEGMLDNPVKTIAQIAAVATQQYWLLPVIEGADVAAKGGDIGDVLEATAKAYIAQEIGQFVGAEVAGATTEAAVAAGVSEATAAAVGEIIASGTASASVAIVYGQDPMKAFIAGGVSAGVQKGTQAALGQLDKATGGSFAKLPKAYQNVISSAISAQLSGGNVNSAIISSAIASSGMATKLLSEFESSSGTKLTDSQRAIAADMIVGVTTSAFTKGNPSAAIQASLMKAGSKALGNLVTKEFKDATAGLTKAYENSADKAKLVDENITKQTAVADKYNELADELNAKVKKQDDLFKAAEKAKAAYDKNPTQATADAANKAAKAYNDYATALGKEYDKTYKPGLDKYDEELKTLQKEHDTLAEDLKKANDGIVKSADPIKPKLDELYTETSKAFVSVMDPEFDAEQYKSINGLADDVDPYEHWLVKGQYDGLKTNLTTAQADIDSEKSRLLQDVLKEKGVSITQVSQKDYNKIMDSIDAKYGDNLSSLKKANLTDLLTGNVKKVDDFFKTTDPNTPLKITVDTTAYGDWKKPTSDNYTLKEGTRFATADEVAAGKAYYERTAEGNPVYLAKESGLKTWDPTKGDITTLDPVIVTATRLDDLQNNDPLAWMYSVGSLPEETVKKSVGEYLYNFAKNTIDLAKSTGNSTIINGAANALKAGGGILQAFNGLVTLAGVNPNNTAVGKFAEQLVNLGKASNTTEYKAALAAMDKTLGDASGVMGTAKAIWKNFTDYPAEFLAEIVGVEGMQELVPLLIGGGAATAAKGLALAKGMGAKVAAEIGTKAGLSAAAVSDIAESVGGSAQSAFNETYNAARKVGKSEAEATKMALDVAARAGTVSGIVTATTLGVGGSALEKVLLGNKGTGELAGVIDEIGSRVKTGAKVTTKEGVTEGIEEGLTTAYLEGQLYQVDPSRDVAKNIATSAILGAVAGGGVAGGAYSAYSTGDLVSNLVRTNPEVDSMINSATSATDLNKKLTDFGITDNITKSNLLDTKYDANYTSTAEAEAALTARDDFNASQADIDALVGATKDADLAKKVETYVDPRTVDRDEVIAAAKAEGLTLNEDQIKEYIGQKNEKTTLATATKEFDKLATTYDEAKSFLTAAGYKPTDAEIKKFVGSTPETTAKTDINAYVDPRMVDYAEAEQFFKDLGYTPTKKEIESYIGQKLESTVSKDIGTYVDPRLIDKDEAIAAAKAEGYTLTDEELKKYTGQLDEKTGLADLVTYVDPLAVTKTEALDYFTKEGYKPTTKELANYIKQGSEADIAKSISTYADPLAVTRAEAADALTKLGYTKPTEAEITQFIKQGKEVDILKDLNTYVDTHQVTEAEAKQFFADLGYTPTKDELTQFIKQGADIDQTKVKTNLDAYVDPRYVSPEEVTEVYKEKYGWEDLLPEDAERLTGQYDETLLEGKAKDLLSTFQYNATEKNIADTKQELLDKMAEYEKAGLTRDEALEKAIGDVATDLQNVESDLTTKIGEVETKIGETEQSILDKMAEYEKAGLSRDEALGKAIEDVSGEVKIVADLVGKPYTEVTQSDIDFVNNLITEQTTQPDLTLTPEQLVYDINQDQKIDITDQQMLQDILAGKVEMPTFVVPPVAGTTEPPITPKWAEPTGIYKTLAEQEAAAVERDRLAKEQAAKLALQGQQRGNFNTLLQMLGQAPDLGGQQVTVKAPDPTRIGYVYDIAGPSIFATPQQAQMFVSPYAQGGIVEDDDVTAELLKILRS